MNLLFLDSDKYKVLKFINNKSVIGLFLGTVLIFSLLISKVPFGFKGLTGIDLLSLIKLTVGTIISFNFILKRKYFLSFPLILLISFFSAWKTNGSEYYFIYFDIIYFGIVGYFLIKSSLRNSVISVLLIMSLIMFFMHLNGSTFAPLNTGPGKYIIFGSTTAVRIYGVCIFSLLVLLTSSKNWYLKLLYTTVIGYYTYAILITVSKIGWVASLIVTSILFLITLRYKKLYNAYAIMVLSYIVAYSNGYFDILSSRIIQSSSINIFATNNSEISKGAGESMAYLTKEYKQKADPTPRVEPKENPQKNKLANEIPEVQDIQLGEQKENRAKKILETLDRWAKFDKTGRIELYKNSLALCFEKPLFGYMFYDTKDELIFFTKPNGHPHNIIIEVILRFGILGFLTIGYIAYKVIKYSLVKDNIVNSLIFSSVIYFFTLSLTNGDIIDNRFIFLMPLLIKNIYNGSNQ